MPVPLEPLDRPGGLDRPLAGRSWPQRLTGRARPWVDWFGLPRLVGATITVVAVVAGGWWLLRPSAPPIEAGLPYAATTTVAAPAAPGSPPAGAAAAGAGAVDDATTTTAPQQLVVYVTGAVVRPGVYDVAPGSRVHVALEAAGGAAAGSDVAALNLAAPLTDGERVYVPAVGETVPPASPSGATAAAPVPTSPVDLNRATAAELDALPGIGPATAAAIVAHREANGPFAAVDDLEAVRGIGPAKLEAIRPLVTV